MQIRPLARGRQVSARSAPTFTVFLRDLIPADTLLRFRRKIVIAGSLPLAGFDEERRSGCGGAVRYFQRPVIA